MKIKPKLTLAFLLASLVPLVVLGVLSYNNYKGAITTEVLNQLQSVAVIQKHRVEGILSQNQERLALVSSRTQLRISLDSYLKQGSITEQERMNTILRDARTSITDFEEIHVLDLNGEVVASTSEAVIGSSLASEAAFVRGRAEEHSSGQVFLDEAEELKVYISGPLYLEGELIGVVVIRSNTDNILSVARDYAGLGKTGETLLTERNEAGDVLFITPLRFDPQAGFQRTISMDELDSPAVQALLKNEGLFDGAIDYRGKPVLAVTQYIEEADWGLVAKMDISEALAPIANLRKLNALTIGLAAAIVAVVSLYLAQSISKPVQDLALVVDKIRAGDVSQRAEVTSRDEIGMLAQGFNEMTGELVGANNKLRNVNRALRTLSECNQILVWSTEEPALLQDVCQALITYGEYRWVWVGFVDPGEPVTLRPVAEAWRDGGRSEPDVTRPEDEKDYTPAMEVVRTGEVQVLRNIPSNAGYGALRAEANKRGYASLIALPLVGSGLTLGVLSIYAAEPATFNEDEARLLTELASDLAYGVTALRTRAEREQVEAKYSILVESSNDGIIIVQDGLLRFANTKLAEITGFSKEETLGKPFTDFVAPEYRELLADRYRKRLCGEKVPSSYEARILARDGERIPVEINASLIEYEGKLADMAIIRDITERKQMAEALGESEEKLRLIFESVADGITETDLEGMIVQLNEAVVRLHGYDSKEELIGKSALSLISEADRAKAEEDLKVTLDRGYSSTLEYTFLKKDGTEFPAELSATLVVDTSGNPSGFVAVTKDITERKKIQEQLILTDRLASIGELAAGVAHELNNPLTAVTGFSELLLERDLPDDVREDVQTVYSESQRAARVVKNLLTFARKHPPLEQPMSLNSAIEKVLELRTYEQRVNDIQVVSEFAPDLPEVKGDFFQLQQVFLNIIINAEHFMIEAHRGGTLTITTERVKDRVRASFADDGPGINKEHLKHIFDPFFTTKEVGKGTGLGLSICHGIVTEHGGRIYAESKYGQGATFIVELPVAVEEE